MEETLQPKSNVQMDDLVEEVCWQLVSTVSVGRVGFVAGDRLEIFPVNVACIGHVIVFRTAAGSLLDSLVDGTPIVVEVDRVEEHSLTGWSVVARGAVDRVNGELLPFIGNSVHPWAGDDKGVWLRVQPWEITGRAISRNATETASRLPYMALD